MSRLQGPVLRNMRCRVTARKRAIGKFSPRERSPRRESRRVIVFLVGLAERVAKKERRVWKGLFADMFAADVAWVH